MKWTTWIKTEPDNTPDETVQKLYDSTRDRLNGRVPDTVRLASLTPEVAALLFTLNRAIHSNIEGLTVCEQEIAALVVSSYNG